MHTTARYLAYTGALQRRGPPTVVHMIVVDMLHTASGHCMQEIGLPVLTCQACISAKLIHQSSYLTLTVMSYQAAFQPS